MLWIPHCLSIRLIDGGEVSLARWLPRNIFWYSFLLKAESTPEPIADSWFHFTFLSKIRNVGQENPLCSCLSLRRHGGTSPALSKSNRNRRPAWSRFQVWAPGWSVAFLTLRPWRWKLYSSPKRWQTLYRSAWHHTPGEALLTVAITEALKCNISVLLMSLADG
jgi:hypothetical protein